MIWDGLHVKRMMNERERMMNEMKLNSESDVESVESQPSRAGDSLKNLAKKGCCHCYCRTESANGWNCLRRVRVCCKCGSTGGDFD